MRVVELDARHVRIPLRKPVKHASHARTETDNLVVRCVLADGTDGLGLPSRSASLSASFRRSTVMGTTVYPS